jgi:hypothetical protein
MAVISNTYLTSADKRKREDFADFVSMITPDETPVLSSLDTTDATSIKHEWSLDALASPSTSNAQAEGDQYTYGAVVATTRVGNYTQISRKEFVISKTQEKINVAGKQSDIGMQRAKKAAELKTDIEVTILSNQASLGGTTRTSGGLRAWIATNDDMGATGASGGYNTGTGVVDAATNGTQRTFTKGILDNIIESAYNAGGNPKKLHVSPFVKRMFSGFMSDSNIAAPIYQAAGGDVTLVGSADMYRNDFGIISVVPNRQMRRVGATLCRNAFLLDDSKLHIAWLRKIGEDTNIATNADADARVLIGEWTLQVDNEAAHAAACDLFGLTATS